METRVIEFSVSCATVDLAAIAVGCILARIAKTLSFRINDEAVWIVSAGVAKAGNAKSRTQFQIKAKRLTLAEAIKMIVIDN